jgi:hypothetical protein
MAKHAIIGHLVNTHRAFGYGFCLEMGWFTIILLGDWLHGFFVSILTFYYVYLLVPMLFINGTQPLFHFFLYS